MNATSTTSGTHVQVNGYGEAAEQLQAANNQGLGLLVVMVGCLLFLSLAREFRAWFGGGGGG